MTRPTDDRPASAREVTQTLREIGYALWLAKQVRAEFLAERQARPATPQAVPEPVVTCAA